MNLRPTIVVTCKMKWTLILRRRSRYKKTTLSVEIPLYVCSTTIGERRRFPGLYQLTNCRQGRDRSRSHEHLPFIIRCPNTTEGEFACCESKFRETQERGQGICRCKSTPVVLEARAHLWRKLLTARAQSRCSRALDCAAM